MVSTYPWRGSRLTALQGFSDSRASRDHTGTTPRRRSTAPRSGPVRSAAATATLARSAEVRRAIELLLHLSPLRDIGPDREPAECRALAVGEAAAADVYALATRTWSARRSPRCTRLGGSPSPPPKPVSNPALSPVIHHESLPLHLSRLSRHLRHTGPLHRVQTRAGQAAPLEAATEDQERLGLGPAPNPRPPTRQDLRDLRRNRTPAGTPSDPTPRRRNQPAIQSRAAMPRTPHEWSCTATGARLTR
jgi:hypothetical protein